MTTNSEIELRQRFAADASILDAWGEKVLHEINSALRAKVASVAELVKIPPRHRVKNIDSLLEKAFYRAKGYRDPYAEITDKVGARFVVLLKKQIRVIGAIVEESKIWASSRDKDFEEERLGNPTTFGYQSVHYVVKNVAPIEYNGAYIPEGTPCEIQIRTLAQHAYAEMTHDTVYKPSMLQSPDALRLLARSMALIEAADETLQLAMDEIEKVNLPAKALAESMDEIYRGISEPKTAQRLQELILNAYQVEVATIEAGSLEAFVKENDFIKSKITDRKDDVLLFAQPIVILLYFLAAKKRQILKDNWPLTLDDLRPIFSDLGVNIG